MGRPEARFTASVIHSLVALPVPVYVYKIPDAPLAVGASNVRFSPAKPFDVHLVIDGVPYALELKSHCRHTAFPFSAVEDHQVDSLRSYEAAGGKGYVVIQVKFSVDRTPKGLEEVMDGPLACCVRKGSFSCVWCVPVEEYVATESSYEDSGRKSIPVCDMAVRWKDLIAQPAVFGNGEHGWDFSLLIGRDHVGGVGSR